MRLFFRSIQIQHADRIPSEGPAILAANHPNSIIDPFALGFSTLRIVHFLGASFLFRARVQGAFLKAAGVVPIYRRHDSPGEMHKNLEVFEACFSVLSDGGIIGIFPEGVTHQEPRVLPIKTGTARIALGAEARHDYGLGVRLVPTGLTYSDPTRFRSRLLIRIGEPILASDYAELHRSHEREAVKRLTTDLQESLEALVLNMPSATVAKMTEDLRDVYAEELLEDPAVAAQYPSGLAGEVALSQEMSEAVTFFCANSPEIADEMHRKIVRYNRMARQLRLRGELLAKTPKGVVRNLHYFLTATLGLVPALYGLLFNYVPYVATRWLATHRSTKVTSLATAKFLSGALLFTLFYGGAIGFVWWHWGILVAAVFGVSLPLAGLWTLEYRDTLADISSRLRHGWLRRRHQRLLVKARRNRRQLLQELDRWRRHYLTAWERDHRQQ